jgi:hypothetical protein
MVQLLLVLALNVRNQGARFRGGPEKTVEQKKFFFLLPCYKYSFIVNCCKKKGGGEKGGWEEYYVLSKWGYSPSCAPVLDALYYFLFP